VVPGGDVGDVVTAGHTVGTKKVSKQVSKLYYSAP